MGLGRIMRRDDYTEMGGRGEVFLTTHWSLVEEASSAGEQKRRALIGVLLNRYWKPVYCYLRRKGHDNEQAKDLTQGFFHEVVLGRKLIQRADPCKGRFRSFLLSALNRYLIDVREAERAQKRISKESTVALEIADPPEVPAGVARLAAEETFNYAWVSALLEEVVADVQATCRQRNLTVHWHVFRERLLRPTLKGRAPPSMKEICGRYDIADPVKASNMLTTVKRLFENVLREHVRRSVVSDADVADELEQIKRFFRRNYAE